jgi:hypothetical protein
MKNLKYEIKKRIIGILGERNEKNPEQEKEYIEYGFPDSKDADMFIDFTYNPSEFLLTLMREDINYRICYNGNRKDRLLNDKLWQNKKYIKECLIKYGFEPEYKENLYKEDWYFGRYKLEEVLDKDEAIKIIKHVLNIIYPNNMHISETYSEIYDEYSFRIFIKFIPYIDKTPQFGFEEDLENSDFGIKKLFYDGKIVISFWHWSFWFRYAGTKQYNKTIKLEPKFEIDNIKDIKNKLEKYIPQMPNYVPEDLRNVKKENFVWNFDKDFVLKYSKEENQWIIYYKEKRWITEKRMQITLREVNEKLTKKQR